MLISIIIPAYDEEARLGAMLEAYLPYFDAMPDGQTEFLIVVNGSTDGTESLARRFASRHPSARVIVEPRRVGKGGAILIGCDAARGDWIGFVDADGSTPPSAFRSLMDTARAGPPRMVIANRWDPASVIGPQSWIRRRASRRFNALVRLLFDLRLADTQCGAKIMHRDVLAAIRGRIGQTRWAFDVDLLLRVRDAGFAIDERPTTWSDVGGSKLRMGRTSVEMFIALVRLRLLDSRARGLVSVYDRLLGRWIHRPPGVPRARRGAAS